MDFESVEQINQLFKSGQLRGLPQEMTVAGVPYLLRDQIQHKITDMHEQGYKSFVIYAVHPKGKASQEYQQAKEEGTLNEWIILIWAMTPSLVIAPARVTKNSAARAKPDLYKASGSLAEAKQQVINDEVEIEFTRFGKKARAKTDTGANMSSLHVDEWRFLPGKGRVEVRSHLLSDNVITIDVLDQVVVKTSEGTEYRPVVALDIKVDGKNLPKAQFNLNDRSHMEDPILLGQNILERGNFLVDPTQHKDAVRAEGEDEEWAGVDWEALQEEYKDVIVEAVEEEFNDDQAKELYEMLLKSNLSFKDIMRHLKTVAIETIEETTEY